MVIFLISRLKSNHYPPIRSLAMGADVRYNLFSTVRQFRSCAGFISQRSMHPLFRKLPRSFFAVPAVPTCSQSFAVNTMRPFSGQVVNSSPDYEHFFRYTSGRWLWDEELQLRDRYKAFDVVALQTVAARAIGSGSCVSIIKLAEGGYNKVFCLLMDDGKKVLARIPNPNAGPPFYTTASEVATMEFVSSLNRDKSQKITYSITRLEIYSKSPFPKYWGGVPHLIILCSRNTYSWKRRPGLNLKYYGMT